jgi:hypothetical protein
MKITIIRADGAVYKDGVSYSNLDLAAVPSDVHALQFNTTSNAGWIEFVQDDFGDKAANEKITTLPAWATTAMTKWDDAKAAEEAARIAAEEAARIAAEEASALKGKQ